MAGERATRGLLCVGDEFLGQEHNADLQKVRDFLELQLHKARVRENRLTGESETVTCAVHTTRSWSD